MKFTPDSILELILNKWATADKEVICTQAPTTFFNAIWPDLWQISTAYSIGDLIHPPTTNGCIYECTVAGTSGSTEPGWQTTQDATFTDGSVTWKTHLNYSVAQTDLVPADLTISDGDTTGRKLGVARKENVTSHEEGNINHTVLLDSVNQEVLVITEASTTIGGSNHIDSGRTVIFFEFDLTVQDPI
jgi:hypothetical protein